MDFSSSLANFPGGSLLKIFEKSKEPAFPLSPLVAGRPGFELSGPVVAAEAAADTASAALSCCRSIGGRVVCPAWAG